MSNAKTPSKLAIELANARSTLKTQKALVVKLAKEYKAERAVAKQSKVADAVLRAQARLAKLLDKQAGKVGAKAIKANRKPSKGTVVTGDAAKAVVA